MTIAFDRDNAQRSALMLRDERLQLTPAVPPGRGWAPAHLEVADLCAAECADIGTVLKHLTTAQQIFDGLPPPPADNRVAAFNSLYFTITDRVAQSLRGSGVRDKAFLELLDVEFAKRYFRALQLWGNDDAATPDAWEVLFRRAQDHGVSKLAAAMLGVNAHINHDLALALVSTWEQLGPPTDEPHPDYLLINKIFFEEIPGLRRRYSTPLQLRIDGLVGTLDDWSQRVLVSVTRAHAWEQAERLWALRDDPDDLNRALLVMDRASAYVGELLLLGDDIVNRGGRLLRGALHRDDDGVTGR